jgi:oxygen-independent coproporphyrinogen-3 oxidase
MLTVVEDTPLASDKALLAAAADADTLADMYMLTCEKLEKAGFSHYEISNFAAKGYECRHNLKYWRCEPYIGIGTAAHSCYKGKRFAVERDIADFIASEVQNVTVTDEDPCGFEEFAMLRLRLKEGLRLSDVSEHRGDIEKKLPPLVKDGYAETDGERIWLTAKGFLMSNSVIEYLIF